jgi:hypothetical protein
LKRNILTIVLALGAAISSAPILCDTLPVRVEIPYGTLVSERTCAGATHVLLDPCAPHQQEVFVVFPDFKDVRRFEGKNVILRGIVSRGPCGLLLLHANEVAVSPILPQCPPDESAAPPAR